MILNVDGYKMIFHLENLLREYVCLYSVKEDMNQNLLDKVKLVAIDNGEENIGYYEDILKYFHIGELVDFIRSRAFSSKKKNSVSSVNISILIKHRNNIMHSRSIKHDEMEDITLICKKLIESLEDEQFELKWNTFIVNDIKEITIPSVYIEYPIGKNFDKLIGRSKELKDIKNEITLPTPVSIVGHGGLGKTALVLQLIEDFIFSPDQPFEQIFFMSFKNTMFENGSIQRFEKTITNHKDLINKLASFMEISGCGLEGYELEKMVWEKLFSKKSLLILDNLETEIVKSNLQEFTGIAQNFIKNFTKPSRLIITSRYGLGDREAKYPLYQFDKTNTIELVKSYLNIEIINEKKISSDDWNWIHKYTNGNPGLIIAFCNTLKSSRKKVSDLRVEYNTKYTSESRELHSQLEEFSIFCFENTIESMTTESQIFLSILTYICSEANINEVNEEFLNYLREEFNLNKLGTENLRSQLLTNIGFLQPIPSSDKYYVNEMFMDYLDGNFSNNVFNVFDLKETAWYSKLEELINHINEIQFHDEVSLGKLLSKLYLSIFNKERDKKYQIKAFFCDPNLDKLINIYRSLNETEVINNFILLDKIKSELKDSREKQKQEQIIQIILKAFSDVNRRILSKQINKLRQRDLLKYYIQLEEKVPILKKKNVRTSIKINACNLLTTLRDYERVEEFTRNDRNLIPQRFNMFLRKVGEPSGSNREECIDYIHKCKEILELYPEKINGTSRAQYKLFSSRYFKINNPKEALKLLDNFEEYFETNNIKLFIFYLESLLIRMECLLKIETDIKELLSYRDRYIKYSKLPIYNEIFKSKRDSFERNFSKIQNEINRQQKMYIK